MKKLTETLRSSIELDEFLKIICEEISTLYNVQRVGVAVFPDPKKYKDIIIKGEYKSSPELKGLNELENFSKIAEYWGSNLLKTGEIIAIDNINKSETPDYFKNSYKLLGVKSIIGACIKKGKDIWGILILSEYNYHRRWSNEEKETLKTMANQIYIAINQAELYDASKYNAEREKILRETIQIIRSTMDPDDIKKYFVAIVRDYFDADRALFAELNLKTNLFLPFRIEKLKTPEMSSVIGVSIEKDVPDFVKRIRKGKSIIIKDMEKTVSTLKRKGITSKSVDSMYQHCTKSDYGIPVKYKNHVYGTLILHYTSQKRALTHDEIDFLKVLSNQVATALYQADLYEKSTQNAEKEEILRKMIEILRSTFDIDKIKEYFVDIVSNYFKTDRCLLFEEPRERNGYTSPIKTEKVRSPEIKSVDPLTFTKNFPEFIEKVGKGKNIIIKDVEKTYARKKIPGYKSLESLHEFGVKSDYGLTIKYKDQVYGTLILHYINKKRVLTHDELDFLNTLKDQAAIALYQADLYRTMQNTAENERALREIILSSVSFDFKYIIKTIVTETGRLFKSDRCFFVEYRDVKEHPDVEDEPIKNYAEYRASENIKTATGKVFLKEAILPFQKIMERKKTVATSNIQESNLPEKSKYMMDELDVKSSLIAPVYYGEKIWGAVIIDYTNSFKQFSEKDINMAKTVASQAAVIMRQAELYNKVEEFSKKETLLREIISNIKLSHRLEHIYNYLLMKLSEIFNTDRAFFIELSKFEHEKPGINYEFKRDSELLPFKYSALPEICMAECLLNLTKESDFYSINDVKTIHPENLEFQKFFSNHNVKSILACPLIKYNEDKSVLGIFVLCCHEVRNWNNKDISLVKEILNSSVSVIWEIMKRNEIDEMRNTFILTLAHDLQVPLVGERRALEFIMSIPPGQLLDKYKDIISETIKNNINLSNFLKKLVDSYSYELGRKKLELSEEGLYNLIIEIVEDLNDLAISKAVSIKLDLEENIPNLIIDKEEIKKVVTTLLANAIIYNSPGGEAKIKVSSEQNDILVCIIDNGFGISKDIQNRLFNRYEMMLSIERKIGAGLGLYLSKQIVEAHNGRLYYETEVGKGSTFCFTLPIQDENSNHEKI